MRDEFLIDRHGKSYVLYAGEQPEVPSGYCRCGCGQKTSIAARNDRRRGHKKGEPVSVIPGHSRRVAGPHFRLAYAGYTTPCCLWLHGKTSAGYAEISVGKRTCLVHILVFESAIGKVPEDMELHHLCERRDCINPQHLVPLSHQAHARASSYAKLSEEDVRYIRLSKERSSDLARRFRVSPQAICDIRKGRRWKGVAA